MKLYFTRRQMIDRHPALDFLAALKRICQQDRSGQLPSPLAPWTTAVSGVFRAGHGWARRAAFYHDQVTEMTAAVNLDKVFLKSSAMKTAECQGRRRLRQGGSTAALALCVCADVGGTRVCSKRTRPTWLLGDSDWHFPNQVMARTHKPGATQTVLFSVLQ